VVNEAPVALQSRDLSEAAAEGSTLPTSTTNKSTTSVWCFCLYEDIMGESRTGFGIEWGSSGAPEPNPDLARRRDIRLSPLPHLSISCVYHDDPSQYIPLFYKIILNKL